MFHFLSFHFPFLFSIAQTLSSPLSSFSSSDLALSLSLFLSLSVLTIIFSFPLPLFYDPSTALFPFHLLSLSLKFSLTFFTHSLSPFHSSSNQLSLMGNLLTSPSFLVITLIFSSSDPSLSLSLSLSLSISLSLSLSLSLSWPSYFLFLYHSSMIPLLLFFVSIFNPSLS